MATPFAFPAPSPEGDMAALQGGFDGAVAPDDRRRLALWRVGRWLRAQGAGRPASLRRADDGVMIVNGQIITVDAHGQIQNVSTMRRAV